MPPDEPNDEEALEELPEDGKTPFSLPTDSRTDLNDQNLDREEEDSVSDDTDPDLDDGTDKAELYDQGTAKDKPNAGNAVADYDPDKDQRLAQ